MTTSTISDLWEGFQEFFLPQHCRLKEALWGQLRYPCLLLVIQSALLLHTPANDKLPSSLKLLLVNHARPLRILLAAATTLVSMRIFLAHKFKDVNASPAGSEIEWPANSNTLVWGTLGCWVFCKTLELGLMKRQPRLTFSDGEEEGTDSKSSRRPPRPLFFPHTWIPLCVDLIVNCNGHGWEHGSPKSKSKAGYAASQMPLCRFDKQGRKFLVSRLKCLLVSLSFTAFSVAVVSHPRLYTILEFPPGFNSFESDPIARSRLMTEITRGIFGCIVEISGIASTYIFTSSLLSLIHFLFDPRAQMYWDILPMSTDPWRATSLHDLWGNQWHSLMRRVWYFNGYLPAYYFALHWLKLPKKVARLLGMFAIFTLSGLFHEAALYGLRRGDDLKSNIEDTKENLDNRYPPCSPLHPDRQGFGANNFVTLRLFWLQAVGLLLEDLFRHVTGKQVKGILGRFWTFLFLIWICGEPFKTRTYHGLLQGLASLRPICQKAHLISIADILVINPLFWILDLLARFIT